MKRIDLGSFLLDEILFVVDMGDNAVHEIPMTYGMKSTLARQLHEYISEASLAAHDAVSAATAALDVPKNSAGEDSDEDTTADYRAYHDCQGEAQSGRGGSNRVARYKETLIDRATNPASKNNPIDLALVSFNGEGDAAKDASMESPFKRHGKSIEKFQSEHDEGVIKEFAEKEALPSVTAAPGHTHEPDDGDDEDEDELLLATIAEYRHLLPADDDEMHLDKRADLKTDDLAPDLSEALKSARELLSNGKSPI